MPNPPTGSLQGAGNALATASASSAAGDAPMAASTSATAGVQRDTYSVDAFVAQLQERAEKFGLKNYEHALEVISAGLDAGPQWVGNTEMQGKYYDKHEIRWMLVAYRWGGRTVSHLSIQDMNWGNDQLRHFGHCPHQAGTSSAFDGASFYDSTRPNDVLFCDQAFDDDVAELIEAVDEDAHVTFRDKDLAAVLAELEVPEALWPLAFIWAVVEGLKDLQYEVHNFLPEFKEVSPPLVPCNVPPNFTCGPMSSSTLSSQPALVACVVS